MSTPQAVRLYTVADAALLLDVGKDYIYRAIAADELAVTELGHGRAKQRVRADVLQAFIDSRTYGSIPH